MPSAVAGLAGADEEAADAVFVAAIDPGIADADGEAIAIFDGVGDGAAAEGDFDFLLNVFDSDAIAGGLIALDVDLHIAFAHDRRWRQRRGRR